MAGKILFAILWAIVGAALCAGIFSLTVAIGCAVNGISFGAQICEWFGTAASTTKALASVAI